MKTNVDVLKNWVIGEFVFSLGVVELSQNG